MQVIFYFDVYPGIQEKYIFATRTPAKKMKNQKRYKVVVNIPDPNEPDEEITQAEAIEVPDDVSSPVNL